MILGMKPLEEFHVMLRTSARRGRHDSSRPFSPLLPDGTDVHNPGIELHWEGDAGEGFPVVDNDMPDVYEAILRRAATKAS